VNDAFGSAHRAHASTVGMIQFVPQAPLGCLWTKSWSILPRQRKPESPCIRDPGRCEGIGQDRGIENLMKFVDRLLIGGAMGYTFLKAKGEPTGKIAGGRGQSESGSGVNGPRRRPNCCCLKTTSCVGAEGRRASEVVQTIPEGKMAVDIGPKTMERYSQVIAGAKTII